MMLRIYISKNFKKQLMNIITTKLEKIEKLKTTLPMLVIILKTIWLAKLLLNLEIKNIGIPKTKSLKEK